MASDNTACIAMHLLCEFSKLCHFLVHAKAEGALYSVTCAASAQEKSKYALAFYLYSPCPYRCVIVYARQSGLCYRTESQYLLPGRGDPVCILRAIEPTHPSAASQHRSGVSYA